MDVFCTVIASMSPQKVCGSIAIEIPILWPRAVMVGPRPRVILTPPLISVPERRNVRDSLPTTEEKMLPRKGKKKYYVHLTSKPKMAESKIRNIIYNTQTKSVIKVNSYVQDEWFSVTKKKSQAKEEKCGFCFFNYRKVWSMKNVAGFFARSWMSIIMKHALLRKEETLHLR